MKRGYERLLKLATFLRSLSRKKFDIHSYVDRGWHKFDSYKKIPTELNDHKCGTTACAIGYCPMIFPRSWRYDPESEMPSRINSGDIGYRAAAEFFQIPHDQSHEFFSRTSYGTQNVTPIMVARRIETFLRKNS